MPTERIRLKGAQTSFLWNAVCVGEVMANKTIEQKAIGLLNAFENAGKPVTRVLIEGRKIELVLSIEDAPDEFERLNMRHGKT